MIVHFMVAFMATTLGAMAGLGGGIIIKPVLDSMGIYATSNVSILSSITVLTMALVSVIRQSANGFSFQRETLLLAIGSIAGGVLGKEVLSAFIDYTPSDTIATSIQSYLLAGLLTIVVLRNRLPRMQIENRGVITVAGMRVGYDSLVSWYWRRPH